MPFQGLRRAMLAAACGVAALVAACGGGQLVSPFYPTRMVVFGDATADAGQVGGARYTVNGSASNWTEDLAGRYSLAVTPVSAGGASYAQGSARIAARPDAAGNAAVPSITEQIDSFLAAGAPAGRDLVVLSAGVSDIVYQMSLVTAGTITIAQAQANVEQAGRDLGTQVRRLVNAGATHVAVAGAYNLGRTPWASAIGQTGVLQTLSSRFNEELLISIVDLGNKVLYLDMALQLNLMTSNPQNYSLSNVTTPVCSSVDAGAGIGIGAGQVNSALCSSATIVPGLDPATSLWADAVYMTPTGNSYFGENAFARLRNRW
jgi:phospholipase/lecithinase/hemolysin